jgi:predicted metal-binding membrane protein
MSEFRAVLVGLRSYATPRGDDRGLTLAVLVTVAVAWIALIAMITADAMGGDAGGAGSGMGAMPGMAGMSGMSGMANMPGMAGMSGMAGMGSGGGAGAGVTLIGSGLVLGLGMWTLMIVAMMVPAALPAMQHVAVNTLRWRRRRAVATFLAAYMSIWIAFGAVLIVVSPLWSGVDGKLVLAVALALAAGWQLTVQKRRALRDCHRPSAPPPRGWRATRGVLSFASRNGSACMRSCWAMMLAMGVASSMMVFWMVALTGIVLTEKLATKPRQATRLAAALLAAGALFTGASALIG